MATAKQNNDLRISNALKMLRRLAAELKPKYNILDFVIHFLLTKTEVFSCIWKECFCTELFCLYSYLVSKCTFYKSK